MMTGKYCWIHKISWALLVIGGLNWGLIGVFRYNLVEQLLGSWPLIVRIVYVLVGLAALSMLFSMKCCGKCEKCDVKK